MSDKKKYILMAMENVRNKSKSGTRNVYAAWTGVMKEMRPHKTTEDVGKATRFSTRTIADLVCREYNSKFTAIKFKVVENVSE